MCFPADHPAWLGMRYGVDSSIPTADVILVLDCDVPWINTQCHPQPGAIIYHIDSDPLKQQMPVFYINAQKRYRVDSYTAITQLNTFITSSPALLQATSTPEALARETARQHSYDAKLKSIASQATTGPDNSYNTAYLTSALKRALPKDTIYAIEAVTNGAHVADQLQCTLPGSWINCGGGGLGWSGGGALGIKLAAPQRFVCQIVGDGTYLFSVPGSVYWISQRYGIPVLTIVLNNKGWNAPKRSLLLVHPDGAGSKVSNEELNISFAPTPDYAGIARAASGGAVWAGHASTVEELGRLLPLAVEAVLGGTSAVLDAHLDGPEGKYGGGKSGVVG